jgi:hypothetical protein
MVELKAELIVVNDLWLLPAIGPCILALEKKKNCNMVLGHTANNILL